MRQPPMEGSRSARDFSRRLGHPRPSYLGDSGGRPLPASFQLRAGREGRRRRPSPTPWEDPMQTLLSLSNDLAAAVEHASRSVVAVHARPRLPSTGVHWAPGIVVTADHTVRMEDDLRVAWPDGRTAPATLAG